MAIRKEQHIFKCIQRDLSVSKFNSEFAFDAKNIRITARDNNTLMTVSNEKGNKSVPLLSSSGASVKLDGILLGYNVLNEYVTLFTKGDNDNIYRLEYKKDSFEVITLFSGNLNFNSEFPIETLGVFENKDLQKVYWVDGRNQPRVVNIVAPEKSIINWDNYSFDFVQNLELKEQIKITRNDLASGLFSSGVIQYAFSYYNRYGQESNIFYSTPLQYISLQSRGASPEEKVRTSFTIEIKNLDKRFDYIRIYSIHRASVNGTPNVLQVVDLEVDNIKDNESLTYTDDGTTGANIEPSQLLYIGGEDIIFQTIAQKDNTLFLGNAKIQRKLIDKDLISKLREQNITFYNSYVGDPIKITGFYPHKNTLELGNKIKTFKYLEWYRFGLQFQYKTGKWSEPIWVKDVYNNEVYPNHFTSLWGSKSTNVVKARYYLNEEVIKEIVKLGFKKVRGVVVHPTLTDREVIAQGLLCPTVYNVGDRFSNSPFAQSSWFTRPNLSNDINKSKFDWQGFEDWDDFSNSMAAVINNTNKSVTVKHDTPSIPDKDVYVDIANKGAWAEFRHNYPIPNNWQKNAEIQCLTNVPETPLTKKIGADLISWVANHSEYFFIDQSILTLHSPDIEFDEALQNLDASGLKMRIVGVAPFTSNASDIDIQTSTPANEIDRIGFYKEFIGSENESIHGIKSLITGGYWFDRITNATKPFSNDYYKKFTQAFLIYPWHRNGSLNNQSYVKDGEVRTAMLSKKKISNLKFASQTKYFSHPWEAFKDKDDNHTGITGVSIFNSKEQSLLRIPEPLNSGLGDLNYYGNIDKIVTVNKNDEEYKVSVESFDNIETFNKNEGYPIVYTGSNLEDINSHKLFTGSPRPLRFLKFYQEDIYASSVNFGTDAVRIKYKTTPHAVFALNYTKDGKQVVLPTTQASDYTSAWKVNETFPNLTDTHFFWNPKAKRIPSNTATSNIVKKDDYYQDTILEYTTTRFDNIYSYSYIAELYNDKVTNRFGGTTEEAFENNLWIPAGNPINLFDKNGEITNYVTVQYDEGDTYYQRYDCLKAYPYTLEDQNSVTDIASFYCETRINLDGRYDKNRGQINNLVTTPENFNKMNPVYNQINNFFNFRGVSHKKFSLNYFPNTITWTKEKQPGSIIDTWTNLTMANTLDLDGDKGEIISLNTFNNEIFCFQKTGLSNILFNSRVQIPASDGVPIEITNGMKVEGKRYISNTIGCNNKWSITESPSGLYFIDNITNSIYLFNGQIQSLSDSLGFRQWVSQHEDYEDWDPLNYGNFRTFYDRNNNDVYFTCKDHCLCYSELLKQFTSFMSYEGIPAMFNIYSDYFSFKDGQIWEQFVGDYNMFYGEYQPYSITFISNENPSIDKIFNNIEFRADSWDGDKLINDETFDQLDVWNEYQKGSTQLNNIKGKPSPLKKKFRVWRANIPRDMTNKRDRIRNTWAYIKLSKNKPNTYRTEFHDVIVDYFA